MERSKCLRAAPRDADDDPQLDPLGRLIGFDINRASPRIQDRVDGRSSEATSQSPA
jgi:hypothetical protein